MVQPTISSKVSDYRLANTGTDASYCEKQQLAIGKKTALRDLQNDNRIMVPKPICNSPFRKDKSPIAGAVKVAGIKRPATECPPSPVCHQSPSSINANGQLVYARRKLEQDMLKSNHSENSDDPLAKQFSYPEKETQPLTRMEGPVTCFPAFAPIPMRSLMTFSSAGPSVPLLGKPSNEIPSEDLNYFTSPAIPHQVNTWTPTTQNWKERFLQLQVKLRNCDHSSQDEYIQMLRSLSSAGRSRQAVELEKRAIHLLLEEGKELQRMRVLNVLGKGAPKNSVVPSTQEFPSEK